MWIILKQFLFGGDRSTGWCLDGSLPHLSYFKGSL